MILGATNRDLYGIRTHSLEKRLALARKHHNSLKILAHTYRAFLGQDITSLRILTRQQIFGLKISHLHLVIVIFRPFLLHNPLDGEEINLAFRDEHENNVVECLKASMDMTELLNAIFQVSQFFNGSWVSPGSLTTKSHTVHELTAGVHSLLWLHSDRCSLRLRN